MSILFYTLTSISNNSDLLELTSDESMVGMAMGNQVIIHDYIHPFQIKSLDTILRTITLDRVWTGNSASGVVASVTTLAGSAAGAVQIATDRIDDLVLSSTNLQELFTGYEDLKLTTGALQIGVSSGGSIQTALNSLTEGQISLTEGQIGGIIVFETYALLTANTPDTEQKEQASYKVTLDPDSSLNGAYSWVTGTTYRKDAELVENIIDPNNTSDGVSGSAVANYVEPNTLAISYISLPTLNLFNYEDPDVRLNHFVDWTNGNINSNGNFNATGFIKVTAALDYTVLYRSHVAYYDASKTFISGNNSGTITEAAPTNAEFMRISLPSSISITTVMISQSSSAIDFELFGRLLKQSQLTEFNDSNYQDGGMSVFKTNYYALGKNILNIADSESGFRGANGVLTSSTTYNVSDFIEVTASTSYSYSVNSNIAIMRFHTAYDEAKNVVSSQGSDSNATVLNVPATGVKYYKISYLKTHEPSNQLESGAVTPFKSYGYTATPLIKQKTITNADIAPSSVAPLQTQFFQKGKNLFNDATSESGFRGKDGVLVASSIYEVSDFIEVLPSTDYVSSNVSASSPMRFITAYDENKVVVSSEGSDTSVNTINVPATGVKYYKISYADDMTKFQLEEGPTVTFYEPFGFEFTGYIIVTNADIAPDSVAPLQTQFIINSANLFDEATSESGFRGANGVLVASSSYRVSDFIEVLPSTDYVSSNAGISSSMRFHTAYDEAKNVVSSQGSDSNATVLNVPATGVKYYKITVSVSNTRFQFEEGSTVTPFKMYGFVLTANINLPLEVSPWAGVDWVSFGDSITQANGYQPYVASELELNSIVRGVGGSQISGSSTNSFNTDARIATLPTTCDALTMMGGTNDWAQNTALGTASLTNVDVSTFYGAINVTLTKLFAKYPLARITINTTPYGEIANYEPRGWNNAYTNTQGLTTRDYANACKIAGSLWGVPVFEVQERAGWNTHNITDFVADGLHPNSSGYRRIAEVVAAGLKSLKLKI
jgi:lysophospholipase L1-like esterase